MGVLVGIIYVMLGSILWLVIMDEIKSTTEKKEWASFFCTCLIMWPVTVIVGLMHWIKLKWEDRKKDEQ